MTDTLLQEAQPASISSAFGAENRARLIGAYFNGRGAAEITPQRAWEDVYRLLLWPDATTGLAHCYESDKCQPGKRWYSRSLAFHDWLSATLQTSPDALASEIDWLFTRAAEDLATEVLRKASRLERIEEHVNRGIPVSWEM